MLSNKDFPPLPSQVQRKPRPRRKRHSRGEASPTATQHARLTSLNDLPDELIVEILDYLPGIDLRHFQLLTLANLSLTNRRLHRIVTDRLYAAYDSFFCTPYPFLRTVTSNPDLASHVKSISFRYGPNVHAERPKYVPSINDKQLIKDSLKRLGAADIDWKQWASDCNDQNVEQEQLYATILLFTANVESLEIDDGALSVVGETANKIPWWLVHFRHFVNGRSVGRVQRFQHLKSIRVDVQYLKLRHLAPIFRLRSMRKVTLTGLVEWAHTEEDSTEALRRLFRVSPIHELHMEKSFVDDNVLDVVISCIAHLRVFRYWSSRDQFMVNGRNSDDYWGLSDQAGYRPPDDTNPSNTWRGMAISLERHSSWLESLSWRDDLHTEDKHYFGHLNFLSGFSKLGHVELPMATLIRQIQIGRAPVESIAANLPPSAQSLTIYMLQDGYTFYQKCLDYVAVNVHDYTPLLRQIKVVQCGNGASLSYDWQSFGSKLIERGVAFELIRSEADSDGDWTPYANNDSSDESGSSGYEESLYSD